MIYYFPLYQGSGNTDEIFQGAESLKKNLSTRYKFVEVKDFNRAISPLIYGVLNYDVLKENLSRLKEQLERDYPKRVFTLGGDCSLEIVPVSYLNQMYDGEITFLWFDAHGDINTPQTSPSGTLYGMPLRVLLGEGDKQLVNMVARTLVPAQIMYIGVRDLDDAEKKYINEHQIACTEPFSEVEARVQLDHIIDRCSKNIYMHIDLDVLDPGVFPDVNVPAEGGLTKATLLSAVSRLVKDRHVVGGSVVEYTGERKEDADFVGDLFARMKAA